MQAWLILPAGVPIPRGLPVGGLTLMWAVSAGTVVKRVTTTAIAARTIMIQIADLLWDPSLSATAFAVTKLDDNCNSFAQNLNRDVLF